MHFLLLNQTFYPDELATSQQLLDLSRFLIQNGHKVSVICESRGYENRKTRYPARETYAGIDIHRVFPTGFGKKNFLFRLTDAISFELSLILKILTLRTPDYIVSFTSPPLLGFLGAIFARFKKSKSVQWLMDINPEIAIKVGYLQEKSLFAKVLKFVYRFTNERSDQIIVLDRFMKEHVEASSTEKSKIHVVPPWSVVKENMPTQAVSNFRKENNLEGKFVILYSGNHSIGHPLDTLFDAALRLRDRKEIVFAFVGSGVRTGDVSRFKAEHGLHNIVQLPLQRRELLADMFKSVNLLVIVMGKELSGLMHSSKIYGILGSGRPYLFIGPQECHVTDILRNCPYGFFAEHGQTNAVLSAIQTVGTYTEKEYALVAQKNTAYARENFSLEKSLGNFPDAVAVRSEITISSQPNLRFK